MDPSRRLEPDRLDGRDAPASDLGDVRGEHHVGSALPDLELFLERTGRPAVRRLDQLEHERARRSDLPRQGAERLQAAADPGIERQRSFDDEVIGLRGDDAERRAADQSAYHHEDPTAPVAPERLTADAASATLDGAAT